MDALSTVQDLGHTFTCCEPCVQNSGCRRVILAITFILATFDLVTDWVNWNQWSVVGGYDQHHFVYIFQTAFFCVASVGTVLWIIETIIIVVKLVWIHRVGKNDAENPTDLEENHDQVMKIDEAQIRRTQLYKTDKSAEQMNESTEEQNIKLDEAENSTEKLKEDTEEQDTNPDEAKNSTEKLKEDTEEQDTNLDDVENSTEKLKEDTEEQDTNLDGRRKLCRKTEGRY